MLRRPTSGETFDRANWQAGERKEEPYRGPDRELVRVCESLPGFVKQGDYEYYSRATDIAITIDRDGGWYIGSEKDEASGTGGAALRAAVLKMSGSQMSDPVGELRSRHPVQFAEPVQLSNGRIDVEFEFPSSYNAQQFANRLPAPGRDVAGKKNGMFVEVSYVAKDADYVFELASRLSGEAV